MSEGWTEVCALDALTPGRGVAALAGDGTGYRQVALFRFDGETVYAVGNADPFSGANVIARGLVGSHGGTPTVASPMYKQRFDLRTGRCLDDDDVAIPVYPTRVRAGLVEVAVSTSDRTGWRNADEPVGP
jgi:nitrite reductase (NADH) small subunit